MNPIDKHNAKYSKEWDIPETGIRLSNSRNLIGIENGQVLNYLRFVRAYISCLCQKLKELVDSRELNSSLIPSVELICYTPIDIMEIGTDSRSSIFEGINKPKDIVKVRTQTLKGTLLGDFDNTRLDKDYRAKHRLIILKLRESGKRLRNWDKVKRLLLHELSHTMCNHLMYYTKRNHLKDFDTCENLLKWVDYHFQIELCTGMKIPA